MKKENNYNINVNQSRTKYTPPPGRLPNVVTEGNRLQGVQPEGSWRTQTLCWNKHSVAVALHSCNLRYAFLHIRATQGWIILCKSKYKRKWEELIQTCMLGSLTHTSLHDWMLQPSAKKHACVNSSFQGLCSHSKHLVQSCHRNAIGNTADWMGEMQNYYLSNLLTPIYL